MPQATYELRARWSDDSAAFKQLGDNFITTTDGMIIPKVGYTPTADDFSAIEYLFQEWDYGYQGEEGYDC